MKKSISFILVAVLTISLALAGCGSKESTSSEEKKSTSTEKKSETKADNSSSAEKEAKIVRMVSGGEPGSLHPALSQGTHESIILDHIFEGLMKRDKAGKIVPGMAKDYKMSDDKLGYTFTIKDGVTWSNGDPVTANDFEYAWKYALKPETASDYAFQLYYLEGGAAYNGFNKKVYIKDIDKDGKLSDDDYNLPEEELVAKAIKALGVSESDFNANFAKAEADLAEAVGVKAVDDKTLEVRLHAPTPYFLELCAFYTYYPVDKKVQESNPDWANDGSTHISNGPFKITEWNHDEDVVLAKNDKYYNSKDVKLDGIQYIILEDQNTQWQMYESDEIDIDNDLPTDVLGMLRSQEAPELKTVAELATYFYRFNTTVKPFNNVKVRKALSMAINRQTLVDKVAQGGQIPAFGVVPPGVDDIQGDFRENGGEYFAESLDDAKALLAEGLKEEGMSELSFTILYNTSEGHKKIAEAIQNMWRKLGVNVELENTEFRVKIDREHALDFEVSRAGWVGDYVDPNTFLDMFTSWSTQNDTGWTNDRYDELITKAGKEFDAAKRMDYMHEAEQLLMEEQPIMPIYYYTKNRTEKPYLKDTVKVINREVNLIYADIEK